MKTTKNFFKLAFLLCCSCFVFIHCSQKKSSFIDSEAQKAIDLEVSNFRYLCHLIELRADSFAQDVNEKYNYPYHLTAYFNTENHRRRERFSIYDVKYYGMTDGYKGFIFSLHKMKVKEITVHWGGDDRFWTLYEWDFLDTNEIMGWEVDLNLMDIEIPEHEKVIEEIRKRVNKDRKSTMRIEFEDLGGSLIY